MSIIDALRRFEQGALGAAAQVINELAGRVAVPIGPMPARPVGDVIEPGSDAARAGADAVERLTDWLSGSHGSGSEDAQRTSRRLLAQHRVTSSGAGAVTCLEFRAPGSGADWGVPGRESVQVAVYVDGRYHSTAIVLGERAGACAVNLGELTRGAHGVELRCVDPAPGMRVEDARATELDGERALVERHAPILELRRDQFAGGAVGGGRLHTDAPLLVVPQLHRTPGGGCTIAYRLVFSNEDGGTRLDDLYSRYGRGIDSEVVYTVRLGPGDEVLEETYQAPVHRTMPFTGEHVGSRPVLRVSSTNNMVSARTHGEFAERVSDAASTRLPEGGGTDLDILMAHPWMWAVMGRELLREGSAGAGASGPATRGGHGIADPRRYLYLGGLGDAARGALLAAGGVRVLLADGRTALAVARPGAGTGNGCTALVLPAGVDPDAVVGVHLLAGAAGARAVVLDAAFGPRELALQPGGRYLPGSRRISSSR